MKDIYKYKKIKKDHILASVSSVHHVFLLYVIDLSANYWNYTVRGKYFKVLLDVFLAWFCVRLMESVTCCINASINISVIKNICYLVRSQYSVYDHLFEFWHVLIQWLWDWHLKWERVTKFEKASWLGIL